MQQGQSSGDTKNITTHVLPEKNHYGSLEIDELWIFADNKKNKVWLIYAYDRDGSGIVAYMSGERGNCHCERIGSAFKRAKGYLWEYRDG